ncbi:glycoside hydrolase [Podospora aff. communis PSN243]|uniref:Glycoside hydrolase n=1 Tax=Podospora aff. communis PSN243 TaxID=3040156 RepID=A0AAV9GQ72_9PEZI|nr:glycoside hydrolase [Podospora aff. communis PSN243]
MAGGRIYFSSGPQKLTFLLNPSGPGGGAALVEPSVLNPTDPNANIDFTFCEFTLNDAQLFANISYVDFVSRIPLSLTLHTTRGPVQTVSGMPANGIDTLAEKLQQQTHLDGMPWDKLVVYPQDKKSDSRRPLRILSPTHGNAVSANFSGYFDPLVTSAWAKYAPGKEKLRINTQTGRGVVEGSVDDKGDLVIAGERFKKPTTGDIWGCNSGPFATGPSPVRNAIIPRLAAAFQRGCICDVAEHPSHPRTFYKCDGRPTNHYARVVHECNLDGKGYAFAYDDVQPDGGEDQSGKVNAGDPKVFVVCVGGGGGLSYGDGMPR